MPRRASVSTSPVCATRAWPSAAPSPGSVAPFCRSSRPASTARVRQADRASSAWRRTSSATGDHGGARRRRALWLRHGPPSARCRKNVPALFLVLAMALLIMGILVLRKRRVITGAVVRLRDPCRHRLRDDQRAPTGPDLHHAARDHPDRARHRLATTATSGVLRPSGYHEGESHSRGGCLRRAPPRLSVGQVVLDTCP